MFNLDCLFLGIWVHMHVNTIQQTITTYIVLSSNYTEGKDGRGGSTSLLPGRRYIPITMMLLGVVYLSNTSRQILLWLTSIMSRRPLCLTLQARVTRAPFWTSGGSWVIVGSSGGSANITKHKLVHEKNEKQGRHINQLWKKTLDCHQANARFLSYYIPSSMVW